MLLASLARVRRHAAVGVIRKERRRDRAEEKERELDGRCRGERKKKRKKAAGEESGTCLSLLLLLMLLAAADDALIGADVRATRLC